MARAQTPDARLHTSRSSAVVVQRVPPADVERFLQWQAEVTRAAEAFAGYTDTDIFPPDQTGGEEWVVLIHFDAETSLARWLESPERVRLVAALPLKLGEFKMKPLNAGFGPWFDRPDQSPAAATPGWKMALTVLLALFPTVMLLTIFVGPLTAPLGLAVSMLIGNALSISVLQWGVMPRLTRWLGPWLQPGGAGKAWTGPAVPILLLLTLAALAGIFRQVTG